MPPQTMPIPNKDTQLCMSLAGRPGNFGTRFHNHLYEALGLNFVYKAFTTTDLPGAVTGLRALGVRGCAVSMPFKEAVIPLLDALEPSAAAIGSVNTIVNEDVGGAGFLRAYNTDYVAIQQLIAEHQLDPAQTVALRGSGGMGKAVARAFADAGFGCGTIIARNREAGQALAQECGWQYSAGGVGADLLVADLLVNVTPIGMAGGPDAQAQSQAQSQALAFAPDLIAQARTVFDVVALPAETPLILEARRQGRPVITGLDVIARQALEQFVLYTGVRPSAEQVAAAVAFARE